MQSKTYYLPPIHRYLTIGASVFFIVEIIGLLLFREHIVLQILLAVDAVPFIVTTILYSIKGSVTAIPATTFTSLLYMYLDSYNQRFQTERTLIRLIAMKREAAMTNHKIVPLQHRYPEIVYTYRLMQLIGKDVKQKNIQQLYKSAFQSGNRDHLKVLNDFGVSAKMILSFLTNGKTSVFMYRSLYKKEIVHWCNALEETLENIETRAA